MSKNFNISNISNISNIPNISSFHKKHSFEKRKEESERILEKYPDRIPVIVQILEGNEDIPDIDKKKYLVPNDLTLGQLIYIIRKRIKLKPEQAIFVFIKGTLPPTSTLISQLYKAHKDEDNFLYLDISQEAVFG